MDFNFNYGSDAAEEVLSSGVSPDGGEGAGADHGAFVLHDVSQFPVVRFETSRAEPGYAARWVAEMDALLARGEPFVLVAAGTIEDTSEDRKARALFIKSRRDQLARVCRAIVGVEPSAVARATRKAQSAVLAKVFGIEMIFAATAEEAMTVARARLADGAAP